MEKSKWKLLDKINKPYDLKSLPIEDLNKLSKEIRSFLIDKVSKTGGHLASNLGVVELTIAMHSVLDTAKDRVIWDVGHQSYVHKILTGRKDKFETLRKYEGLSGFPKTKESIHDAFNTGHSSTSISAALGLAKARDLKKEDHSVLAVIGDGALTGGMAFEALNDAGRSPNNLIVILNDNEMSIDRNVGGMSSYLSKIRTEPFYYKVKEDIEIILEKLPPSIRGSATKAIGAFKGGLKYLILAGVLFEELGFKYLGPIDGHDILQLKDVINRAKSVKGPVFIHILTQKGKGYYPAELRPHMFHGVSPFEIDSGESISNGGETYSDVFGKELVSIASENIGVAAITAAMPSGTGLSKFSQKYPERFFDVGIAEQHAVTFAAGLSMGGLTPVFAVYSSFLQRAYDQVSHDVAVQGLHVVFAIDRAGVVGEDGETHQGIYDISFMRHIPNMTIIAPADYTEFRDMMHFAINDFKGPVAIRYPRGNGSQMLYDRIPVEYGKGVLVTEGNDVTIISEGPMVEVALKVCRLLKKYGISAELINSRFIKPLDEDMIIKSATKTRRVITLEDNSVIGGLGSGVAECFAKEDIINIKLKMLGLPDKFVEHGSRNQIFEKYGLTVEKITLETLQFCGVTIEGNENFLEMVI
jgi:1-deoxy-D-xylulose-5-phosphate synthase